MSTMREWLRQTAQQRVRSGRARTTDPRRNPQANGGLLDLASNDYLGLAGDPRLRAAAAGATRRYGTRRHLTAQADRTRHRGRRPGRRGSGSSRRVRERRPSGTSRAVVSRRAG